MTPRPENVEQVVSGAYDDWQSLRAVIVAAAVNHPRHLCWVCGTRMANVTLPGLPVGACRECDAQAREEHR